MGISLALPVLVITLTVPIQAMEGVAHAPVGAASRGDRGDAGGPPRGVGAEDWAGVRTAHEAWKRRAVAIPEGHRARNDAQRWWSTFDGRGVSIAPDDGEWTWGLELLRWGFAGAQHDVEGRAAGCADGERVEYDRGAALTEWFVNGAGSLEHGFTMHRRPEGGGALELELGLRGGLQPRVDGDGRGVRFAQDAGGVVLSYAGLHVFDAAGHALEARITAREDRLCIEIDERGALYPLTIDPAVQQAYVKASSSGGGDLFGDSVSISGDTLVVGAPYEDSAATGVNGDQTSNAASNSGAAYVFVCTAGVWVQQAYLKASNTQADDLFGYSVSVSGDTVVVGAYREDSSSPGVNGDQSNNGANSAGAAYVFVRNGGTWSQQAYLKASNPDSWDIFGYPVFAHQDTVVVGAPGESSNAINVDGDQLNNLAPGSGAVYVFVRSGTTWVQQAYIKASNTAAYDGFCASISMSGDTLVVGASGEDSNATGSGGDWGNDLAPGSGAAYVYVRSGTTWNHQAYLKASNTGAQDRFGYSIDVSGDTLVVGAAFEDSSATGINGDGTSNGSPDSGAAYVFVRSAGAWSQQAYIKASNTDADDWFGNSVSLSGDLLVVGAPREDSNATGVDGDDANNFAYNAGAAYLFVRSAGTWAQQVYIKGSNTETDDGFGASVCVSGATLVLGAAGDDSNASGVNGDGSDNSLTNSGAVYVVLPQPPAPTSFCFGDGSGTACPCGNAGLAGNGCANSVNPAGANLAVSGTWSISVDSLRLSGSGMPDGSALFFQGTDRVNGGGGVAFGDGLRCAGGAIVRLKAVLNAAGASSYPEPGDPPTSVRGMVVAPGVHTYQAWYRNAAAFCTAFTYNLTNAVEVSWGP